MPDPHRYRALAPTPPEGALSWEDLFPAQTEEIEVEIGFGRGRFLIERAQVAARPRLLGIEIKKKWSYLVAERAQRRGLTNVVAWGADARVILPRLPAATVSRFFMHFPDPWWKKRHEKRSLLGPVLLDDIARLLKAGGELFVQTDVEERAQLHLAAVSTHPAFVLGGDGGLLPSNPYQARSNREVRADEDGLPVYRTLALRR